MDRTEVLSGSQGSSSVGRAEKSKPGQPYKTAVDPTPKRIRNLTLELAGTTASVKLNGEEISERSKELVATGGCVRAQRPVGQRSQAHRISTDMPDALLNRKDRVGSLEHDIDPVGRAT